MALLKVFAGSGGHEKKGWYEGPIWWERPAREINLIDGLSPHQSF